MKYIKMILIFLSIIALACIAGTYVYVGTYFLPIAPYWVTQLPPNPPKPKLKHGEFSFSLEYEINGERKLIKDELICDFIGFEVNAIGGPKKRKWTEYVKNEQNNEILHLDSNQRFSNIVLYNVEQCKVVLSLAGAEYFLSDPEYFGTIEMPFIRVYDMNARYYKYPNECTNFLNKYSFKIISWYCDEPIQNNFDIE